MADDFERNFKQCLEENRDEVPDVADIFLGKEAPIGFSKVRQVASLLADQLSGPVGVTIVSDLALKLRYAERKVLGEQAEAAIAACTVLQQTLATMYGADFYRCARCKRLATRTEHLARMGTVGASACLCGGNQFSMANAPTGWGKMVPRIAWFLLMRRLGRQ